VWRTPKVSEARGYFARGHCLGCKHVASRCCMMMYFKFKFPDPEDCRRYSHVIASSVYTTCCANRQPIYSAQLLGSSHNTLQHGLFVFGTRPTFNLSECPSIYSGLGRRSIRTTVLVDYYSNLLSLNRCTALLPSLALLHVDLPSSTNYRL